MMIYNNKKKKPWLNDFSFFDNDQWTDQIVVGRKPLNTLGIPLTFIMVVSLSSNSPLSYGPYQEAEEPAAQ